MGSHAEVIIRPSPRQFVSAVQMGELRRAQALVGSYALVAAATIVIGTSATWANSPNPSIPLPSGGRSMAAPLVSKPMASPQASQPTQQDTPREIAPIATPPKPASVIGWNQADVDSARARCTHLLRGIDIVSIPVPSMKDGPECGTPAPIELVSVGKNPQVTFSPTITVTCDMAAALSTWINRDLQPLARKHLGGSLVQIATMSSYSCRNAYGRTASRLSEHGRANAVDIRNFLTTNGHAATVLADWGPTGRDIRAQVSIARAAAQKTEAARAAALALQQKNLPKSIAPSTSSSIAAVPPVLNDITTGSTAAGPQRGISIGGRPATGLGLSLPDTGEPTGMGLSNTTQGPQRLGGPKPVSTSQPASAPPANPAAAALNRMQFLRGAHETGCKIFGTILGPEANDAHRNHFHVDMAERKTSNFCE